MTTATVPTAAELHELRTAAAFGDAGLRPDPSTSCIIDVGRPTRHQQGIVKWLARYEAGATNANGYVLARVVDDGDSLQLIVTDWNGCERASLRFDSNPLGRAMFAASALAALAEA